MPKLISPMSEGLALKGLCSKNPEIRGYFMASLNKTFFMTTPGKETFEYIEKVNLATGKPPTFSLMAESIKLTSATKEFLQNVFGSPQNLDQAKQITTVLDDYRKAFLLYDLSKDIISELEKKKYDVETLTTKLDSTRTALALARDIEDCVITFGENSNAESLVKKVLYDEEDIQVIPTLWKSWDDENGGLPRGEVVLIAGSTGSGKSQVAVQLSVNIAKSGYKALVVPLEMSVSSLMNRLLANLTGIDSRKFKLKKLAKDEKTLSWETFNKFNSRLARKGGRLEWFKPGKDITAESLMSAVHSYGSDAIIIDYVSLLDGADGDDQWRKLGAIVRFFKIYAEVNNKLVVILAQVTEEGRLKYSQAMKDHAAVMFSFRATKESREQGILKINVDKSREQDGRPFNLKIDYALSRVTDIPNDEIVKPERKKESSDDMMPDLTA